MKLSRRSLLKGLAAVFGAAAIPATAATTPLGEITSIAPVGETTLYFPGWPRPGQRITLLNYQGTVLEQIWGDAWSKGWKVVHQDYNCIELECVTDEQTLTEDIYG